MRNKKRSLGTGATIAIAMVVATLPMAAEADAGNGGFGEGFDGPWIGTDWTPPRFQFRHRWVNPDSDPGRWGGYRGNIQPPTIEPPVYDERDWYPSPDPSVSGPSDPDRPTGTATVTAEPTQYPTATGHPTAPAQPTSPVPTDPGSTGPAPTEPRSTAVAPTTPAPSAPGVTAPAPTGSVPVLPPSAPGTIKNRSGLPWRSGVYARGQGPAGTSAFATWRGRSNDVVIDWPSRKSWDDIINPDWLYKTWANTPETKVFGVAPVPEADAGATMAGCAAGSYNDKWRQYGLNIKAAGLDDESVIRLGWEFNGNWYKWQASDPAQFAECWRQIVGTVERVAPALKWDWNVNRGRGQSVADARLAYPGDAYVDFVGVDSYDAWPGARDEAGWQAQYAGEFGLKFWADFAAAHGKKLSVGEWGNYPGPATAGQSGGDNPFYIAKMMGFFRSQGSDLAYEAYFNESASYFAGAIFAPAQVPAAAAQYRKSLNQ